MSVGWVGGKDHLWVRGHSAGTEYGGSHSRKTSGEEVRWQPDCKFGGCHAPMPLGPHSPRPGPPPKLRRGLPRGLSLPGMSSVLKGGRSLLFWVDPIVVAGFSWHSEDRTRCVWLLDIIPGTAWMLGGINCAPAGMCRSEVGQQAWP